MHKEPFNYPPHWWGHNEQHCSIAALATLGILTALCVIIGLLISAAPEGFLTSKYVPIHEIHRQSEQVK